MNMLKKSIVLFVVIVMVLAVTPAAFAAEGLPGDTVTVHLNLGTGYGIDGNITVNDPDGIISSVSFTGPSGYDGAVVTSGSGYFAYYSKNDVTSAGNCTITASVTLKNNVNLTGKRATISFNGTTSQLDNGGFRDAAASASVNVIMVEPEIRIDYTELQKQIDIAEALNKGDYTADSWKVLEEALANGKNHLTSKDQAAVDKAAKDLADAIAALVPMDYSKLEEAIQNGNDLINDDELGKLWKELMDAITNGNGLIGSGNQEAVDAAADNILRIITELKESLKKETLRKDADFCNIPCHKLWPILFFVSLIGNIALVIVLIFKKKKDDRR